MSSDVCLGRQTSVSHTSHTQMHHVTHMYASCHICTWVMPHMHMGHVAQIWIDLHSYLRIIHICGAWLICASSDASDYEWYDTLEWCYMDVTHMSEWHVCTHMTLWHTATHCNRLQHTATREWYVCTHMMSNMITHPYHIIVSSLICITSGKKISPDMTWMYHKYECITNMNECTTNMNVSQISMYVMSGE